MNAEEYQVINLINQAYAYFSKISENEVYERMSQEAIDKADNIMKKKIHEVFKSYGLNTLISMAEVAVKVPKKIEISRYYLDLFFKMVKNGGQFYARALILKATLQSIESNDLRLKADENVKNAKKAFSYVEEAIQIIAKNQESKKQYSFLIYNASICVYNIIRPFFRKGWMHPFLDIIQQLDKLLEEVQEPDNNWRVRFSWVLFNCLYDADQKNLAFTVFDKLWECAKKDGGVEFKETLFRHRVHFAKENQKTLASIKKEAESAPSEQGLNHLLILQMMKSGIKNDNDIEKELISLIYAINPAILTNQETISNTKLTPILQERLAEAARVAINFGLTNICNQILNFLQRIRQTTQKTYVWMEYSKAEILVKVNGNSIDPKTGIRLNMQQIRQQEIERRIEALKILEKTMSTNRRLNDPDLIYEGCVLIWNIGLPFINQTYKDHVYEPFLAACELLEEIQSTDHSLRVKFHLELAKIDIKENLKKKANDHILRALKLDYSVPLDSLESQPILGEDLGDYQRIFDRYLTFMNQKITKVEETDDPLLKIIKMIDSAKAAKLNSVKQQKIHQALKVLINLKSRPYSYDPAKDLVEEEIEKEKLEYNLKQAKNYKRSKLLAGEIAKLAFEWKFSTFVQKASELIFNDKWSPISSSEMVVNQIETYHVLAQTKIERLFENNVEPAFEEFIVIDETKTFVEDYSDEDVESFNLNKREVVEYHIKALKLAREVQQNWMIFNGAIYIWNNYLLTFKNPLNDTKLMPEITELLKEYFEAMKDSIKDIEKKMMSDYDLDSKIQVYGNIGIMYARLLEGNEEFDEVLRVSETLLLAPLSPHTRKLVNSIKARVGSQAKGGKGSKNPGKGQQITQNNNDQILFDVVNQLEIIQNNTNKSQTPKLIQDCFKSLTEWKARDNDETDLELHAELWTKLSKLALNDKNTLMYKYSLRSVENALSMIGEDVDVSSVPTNRLRWYSLAEYLYAETLCKMVNPETQERDSQESILFHALKHSLEACHKASKARNHQLVIDSAKQFWDITSSLKSSFVNRRILIKPIFSVMHYLKIVKENEFKEPDLIILLGNVLFQGCMENDEWNLGETGADMALELVPSNLKKQIWSWKMIFMSKQGKDELSIMNNIKECDPFLQARVWLKLARSSNQVTKQYTSFSNAIEVLKKEESVAIVTVLIEFSEWLLRNKYETGIVKENLLMAADILLEVEYEGTPPEIDDLKAPTIFSRSSRGKKSSMGRTGQSMRSKYKSRAGSMSDNKSMSRTNKLGTGSNSRMNRSSNREGKTMKTEQKLIVAQNDEEGFTESLNIKHYDQLFRIHAMLAKLAKNTEEQIQYSFDSLFFIVKILEVTFQNLDSLQKATEKNLKEEESKNEDSEKEKTKLPQSIGEWIDYDFPKELIEKIQVNTESNILCRYAFDFPELTFFYLNATIDNLEDYGLHTHNVVLFKFAELFVSKLMVNEYLEIGVQLKFARCMSSIGYIGKSKEILNDCVPKCRLKEKEFKFYFSNLERMVARGNINGAGADKEAKVRGEYYPYEAWIMIAGELIQFGNFFIAQKLLTEARRHSNHLGKQEEIGYIEYLLSSAAYQEGRFKDALIHQMNCHGLIKSLSMWNKSYELTYKILKSLKKFEDIDSFLQKIYVTLNDCKDNQKDYENVSLYLGWSWSTVELLRARNFFEKSLKNTESVFDLSKLMNDSLKSFMKNSKKFGCLRSHILLANELVRNVENKLTQEVILDKRKFRKVYKLAKNALSLSERISIYAKRNLKYLHSTTLEVKSFQSPLFFDLNRLKLITARLELFVGEMKHKSKSHNISIKQIESLELSDPELQNSQNEIESILEFESALKDLPEKHVRYLMRLNREVEKVNSPQQKRLDSFEKATLLAREVKDYYDNIGGKNLEADLVILRGLRLKRKKLGKFSDIWKDQVSDSISIQSEPNSIEDDHDEEAVSEMLSILERIMEESKKRDNEFFNFIKNSRSFINLERFSNEIVNIYGDAGETREIVLSSLAEYQSNIASSYFWKEIKTCSRSEYRPILLKRLISRQNIRLRYKEKKLFKELSSDYKLIKYLKKYQRFDKIMSCLPPGSSFVIFQFNRSMDELFVGYIYRALSDEEKNEYNIRKIKLDKHLVPFLLNFLEEQQEINSLMFKTPLLTKEEMIDLEQHCDERYQSKMEKFRDFMKPVFEHLDQFINRKREGQPKEEEEKEESVPNPGKKANGRKKKQDKKEVKKSKEEQMELSEGGVSSLTILVDNRFITLPFELLEIFKNVPLISKDFSLQAFYNRLNLDEEHHIINECEFKNLKYIAYDFKERNQRRQEESEADDDLNKKLRKEQEKENKEGHKQSESTIQEDVAPQLQLNYIFKRIKALGVPSLPKGIDSSTQIPSMGDWVNYFNDSSMFVYYGNKALMNMISSSSLIDMINDANMQALIVIDRINPLKKIIQKVSPIEKNLDLTPLIEFPRRNLVLSTLLGARFSLCNKVNVNPEANIDVFDTLFRKIAHEGKHLGKFLSEFKKGKSHFIDQDGNRIELSDALEITEVQDTKKRVKSSAKVKDKKKKGKSEKTSEKHFQSTVVAKIDPEWTEAYDERKILHLQNYIILGLPFFKVGMN